MTSQPLFEDAKQAAMVLDVRNEGIVDWMESFWNFYEPLADVDFRRVMNALIPTLGIDFRDPQYVKAVRAFRSRFWEMHVAVCLDVLGFRLIPKPKAKEGGPDLCIDLGDRLAWVECVMPDPGTGDDAVVEPDLEKGVVNVAEVPVDKYQLRMTSGLSSKKVVFDRYIGNRIVGEEEVLIIALNSKNIAGLLADMDPPHIAKCLLGLGPFAVDYSFETGRFGEAYLTDAKPIARVNADPVPANGFDLDYFKTIAGVLYSHVDIWNFRGDLRDHLLAIPNPNSENRFGVENWSAFNRWERGESNGQYSIGFNQRRSLSGDSRND